jgi:hypothetical protein
MLIHQKIFLDNHPELGLNKIPQGWCVHHINENHYDNELGNLQLLTLSNHTRLHQTGAKNCMYGKHHTDDAKLKIAESSRLKKNNLGKHHTDESKLKLSIALRGEKNHNYGKCFSKETRKRMSEAKTGKEGNRSGTKSSDETKLRISESKKGNACRRKVTQEMIDDVTINGITKKDFCVKYAVSHRMFFTIRQTQVRCKTDITIEDYLQTAHNS